MGTTFYLCDGRDGRCGNSRSGCYKYGGDCYHTDNIDHAKNFYRGGGDEFWEDETGERLISAMTDPDWLKVKVKM